MGRKTHRHSLSLFGSCHCSCPIGDHPFVPLHLLPQHPLSTPRKSKNQTSAPARRTPVPRLNQLFSHLNTEKDPPFWTQAHKDAKGEAVFFYYEEEADPLPDFCGTLLGMLYINRQDTLCLASWPPTGQAKVEALLEQISSIQWMFFDPKKADWKTTWTQKEKRIPDMIKIIPTLKGTRAKSSPLIFFSPTPAEPLTYPLPP